MPIDKDIKKVLIIGSGPIQIGQAAEFDYSGSQACKSLREEGIETVLVNSNPATIQTDMDMADTVYTEPLTPEIVSEIIKKENVDAILPTMGGQTGLNIATGLGDLGLLDGIKVLGSDIQTIKDVEDRDLFGHFMDKLNEPIPKCHAVESVEEAIEAVKDIGYPVIVRPAFTLGGTGGGVAYNEEELIEIATHGLDMSFINQVLIDESVLGWKEFEYEVMRDKEDTCIIVCNMENIDPMGIHTGESVVVAPAQNLNDRDSQALRDASIKIIRALGIQGGCNIQFAVNPETGEYKVIEVNPRVSRSSALASKATGYPIAKISSKIALGMTLDEIKNDITKETPASFEPAIDYVVVKIPRWPFDKFRGINREIGVQMKATGEVMAIGTSFEQAIMKAVRSTELGVDSMNMKKFESVSTEELLEKIPRADDERAFQVYELLKRGVSVNELHNITMIDEWFLDKLKNLTELERWLTEGELSEEKYLTAKKFGYLDSTIERFSGQKCPMKKHSVFKMVDTCAGEFKAETPYFYSTFDEENEAKQFIERVDQGKKKVIVFGSGPIRIGQGIEFDYCSVHCVWTLKEQGYEAIICNNNPETVSTDFDTGDRLYFDPLTKEDVESIIETEQPYGVVVQFGGQTAIKLTRHLADMGVNILGTSADSIDAAEDRERFDELLEKCGIPRPDGYTVMTTEEAVEVAGKLGYPVLLRPSYVLGGQNMIIAHSEKDVVEYMGIITRTMIENPVLIDKYMMGKEVEVDAICDGKDFLIPGIMEHIERAGVHSGDSISVYPAQTLSQKIVDTIIDYTKKLAVELNVIGLVNIQYVVYNNEVYVIEVNPRSSRTVPYISKVTGIPMVDIATKIMLGSTLKELGYESGLYKKSKYVAVKVPVFSFEKLQDVDTMLGPEMKSTGECLGIAETFEDALLKGLVAAGYDLKREGGVLISVRDQDKQEIISIADKFSQMGFELYGTSGTASTLNKNMIATNLVNKISEKTEPNVLSLLESGKIHYVISTSEKGRLPARDSVKMRRKSVERSICSLTAIDTAKALANVLLTERTISDVDMIDITTI